MEDDNSIDPESIGESLRWVAYHSYPCKQTYAHLPWRQIAGSDVIILNKIDLVSPETLEHTEALIRRVNPAAPVHRTIKGNIDLKHIMEISAFTSPPHLQPPNLRASHDPVDCQDPDHVHPHPAEPNHYELRGISSLQVSCPPLDQARFDKLDQWIRTVLWEKHVPNGNEELLVLRCKGLITMVSGEEFVLQGVRSMYEIEKLEGDNLGVSPEGKLVLIGKGLDNRVRQSLEDILR